MNTNYLKAYLIYAVVAIVSVTISIKFETKRFHRLENFGDDINLTLPKYNIKAESNYYLAEDGINGDDQMVYEAKVYTLLLDEPLSERSNSILTSQRKGWKSVSHNKYSLNIKRAYERLLCTIDLSDNVITIEYRSGYLIGLPVKSIILALVLAAIMLSFYTYHQITAGHHKKRLNTKE